MENIKIGKAIIETLTTGMYEDPRFVYREYIQNAVDQIDIAIQNELLESSEAIIYIDIDKPSRNITIHDNATGIESVKVKEILGNIALSEKDGFYSRGFRGIGRLGGLGYCKILKFITSSKGESVKSIMTWDAKLLREIVPCTKGY